MALLMSTQPKSRVYDDADTSSMMILYFSVVPSVIFTQVYFEGLTQ